MAVADGLHFGGGLVGLAVFDSLLAGAVVSVLAAAGLASPPVEVEASFFAAAL
jgi:hypothetical protein